MFDNYSPDCQLFSVTDKQHILALNLRLALQDGFGGDRVFELSNDTPDDGAGAWLQAIDDPDEKVGVA